MAEKKNRPWRSIKSTATSVSCCLCKRNNVSSKDINLGDLFKMYQGNLYVHYYCVLLSKGVKRSGTMDEGLMGFLVEDIIGVLQRTVVCWYCKKPGASILCDSCNLPFHLPCGISNQAKFTKAMLTYCHEHHPNQVSLSTESTASEIPPAENQSVAEEGKTEDKAESVPTETPTVVATQSIAKTNFPSAKDGKVIIIDPPKQLNNKKVSTNTFKCPFEGCSAAFDTSTALQLHAKAHYGGKSFACSKDHCSASFCKEAHLKSHMTVHLYDGHYPCQFARCCIEFNNLISKQKHEMEIHGRIKLQIPCIYENCKAVYSAPHSINSHLLTHESSLKCTFEGCRKVFADSKMLVAHMRTHTGMKPFQCQVDGCFSGFQSRQRLREHMLVHIGSYSCSYINCKATFSSAGTLRYHQRTFH